MLFARFPLRGELASAAANDFLEERRLEWQLSKWNRLWRGRLPRRSASNFSTVSPAKGWNGATRPDLLEREIERNEHLLESFKRLFKPIHEFETELANCHLKDSSSLLETFQELLSHVSRNYHHVHVSRAFCWSKQIVCRIDDRLLKSIISSTRLILNRVSPLWKMYRWKKRRWTEGTLWISVDFFLRISGSRGS